MLSETNQTDRRARIISGTEIALGIMRELNTKAKAFAVQTGILPHLAVLVIGDNPASHIYVRSKAKAAAECGFKSTRHELPEETGQPEILELISRLNQDPAIHGILVQLPLPAHIDAIRVIEAIAPHKDVDGFHPRNVGQLTVGMGGRYFTPCTPAGCMVLIEEAMGKNLAGKDAVVIGRSNIVGKPMATLLGAAEATVTSAHAKTRHLEEICRHADLIVAAAGAPNLVRKSWVKPGAVLIDVGINRIVDSNLKNRIVGDIAFEECLSVAGAITPVPGGVGPMTIAMLMSNTFTAAQMC
jgi:methylenetetrahydrofolate dehydrogenase (NADP+)/methenyltetrahydrofolate cyclohydrolase